MTKFGHAGMDECKPVLLIHDSAGFPFGLDADGSLTLVDLDSPASGTPLGDGVLGPDFLTVFASFDAAVRFSYQAESSLPLARALVLADDWYGHDYALRSFTLLFLQHRLVTAGFNRVRFLSTDPEQPPGGWAPDLDVVEVILPFPEASPEQSLNSLSNDLLLLLDGDPGDADQIARASACVDTAGATIRLSVSPGAGGDLPIPPTVHLVQDPVKDWPWLAPRTAVVAGSGLAGWQRGPAVMAARAGVPTVDLKLPDAWDMIQSALATGSDRVTAPESPQAMAAWFLEQADGMSDAAVSESDVT